MKKGIVIGRERVFSAIPNSATSRKVPYTVWLTFIHCSITGLLKVSMLKMKNGGVITFNPLP